MSHWFYLASRLSLSSFPTFTQGVLTEVQFEDQYLKQGFQGGQRAAQTLLSALPKLLAHATPPPTATREVAEITLDAEGLVVPAEGQEVSDANPEVKELGSVVVQLFVNKSGLGSTLIKVS